MSCDTDETVQHTHAQNFRGVNYGSLAQWNFGESPECGPHHVSGHEDRIITSTIVYMTVSLIATPKVPYVQFSYVHNIFWGSLTIIPHLL